MLYGVSSYGEIAIAESPDPKARKQGAIVATLSTVQRYQALVRTDAKVQANLKTAPER